MQQLILPLTNIASKGGQVESPKRTIVKPAQ